MSGPEETARRFAPEFVVTLLVLAAYVIWMLLVPAWPSQDGPVHLYYADIFGKLLRHSDPGLEQYFRIKHLLPPYALYYYALVGLSSFVSSFLADRIIICCYLVSFVFGFRFVAKRLGPSGEVTTLLATLLLLNWPLGMGFVNYCLALSFALWGLGLWLRFGGRHDGWLRATFVVLAFAIMLTHPVPLLLLLGLCAVLLLVDRLSSRYALAAARRRSSKRDVVTFLLSASTVAYIKLFTTAHPLEAVLPETGSFAARVLHRAARLAKEDGMTVLFGSLLSINIYRIALWILLVACIVIGLRRTMRSLRRRTWSPADTIVVLGLLLLVALPFIPLDLNGLFYFADRLPLLVWLTLLLGASSLPILPRCLKQNGLAPSWARTGAIVFAIVANGALLVASTVVIWPISKAMVAVQRAPVLVPKQVGVIIEDPRQPGGWSNAPSWDPYYWAAIHVVRHNDGILANAPWMDETILPVGAGPDLPEERIQVLQTPVPSHLYGELLAAPEQDKRAMDAVSFAVIQQHNRPHLDVADDPMMQLGAALQERWICHDGVAEWYRVCERQ